MEASEAYRWLMTGSQHSACDRFDAHLIASVVSLALMESVKESRSLTACVGLEGASLTALVSETFPHAREVFARLETEESLERAQDEACLRDLLVRCATAGSPFQEKLASIVARRAQRPNHLWQDLGLPNRGDLTLLMKRHFERAAAKNQHDMKWKKFLYRMVCGTEGFTICTSPVCSECSDYHNCFGAEDGEARLHSLEVLGEHVA